MKLIVKSLFAAIAAVCLAPASAGRKAQATIDVIAYNDVYELLQDDVNGLKLGGPSRVVPIVQAMRAKNPNSLVIFAGDTMSPSLWSSQFKGMQMVEAHNALGVDVASLGNHEFDFGLEAFYNVSEASNFPWLNANCYEKETDELLGGTTPRLVKEFNDPKFGKIKIGFFGVMYDMKDSSKGLYWTDPIAAAKTQVKILREKEKVDFVIALTHQDLADDNRLSKDVKGIDIIYGGHDHSSMLQTNFGTPYLKADFDFRSVWSSHIEFFAAENKLPAMSRMTHNAIPIIEELPTDAALDKVIDEFDAKIKDLHKRVVGSLCEPLDLSNKVVRAMDCPVGNIFADATLEFYGPGSADIAVANGGGIRGDKIYPAGDITVGQIIAWSPFGNTIMVAETDGAAVKKFITNEMKDSCGAGSVITLNGHYVHPAGIKFEFQCTGEGKGDITSIEWFKHPTKTGSLKDDEKVLIAMSNYWYNAKFAPLGLKNKLTKTEAEAGRIDTALEQYASKFPDNKMCVKAEGRSSVSY
ncbi:TPA: hypothetical protein N0F65_009375 [Lagenidium giganteum]|uniref:Apyrase n=1 Tax=Lagenidium giganteum TaxID=4803 RepID=A0AAV2ZAN2_9STRA|nr:TPA: hypothetical protein N0F65_009375 [Lagenidium giganteum]